MNQPPPAEHFHASAEDNGHSDNLPPGYVANKQRLDFSRAVPDNGYLWWYVDAISDDGQQAMTMIIFVGSVFSPYYATARGRGPANAEEHCAFNTIIYGPGGRKRWSMTERSGRSLQRSRHSFSVGPSRIDWNGESLEAQINEYCVPTPRPMRGTVSIRPQGPLTEHSLMLDRKGHHRWYPLAPMARVAVDFPTLGVRWEGSGYLDSNSGSEALADGFTGWDWLRLHSDDGECRVRYEAREPDQQPHRLALHFHPDGRITSREPSPATAMAPTTIWRVNRRLPQGRPATLLRTVEDTPFYARSLIHDDDPVTGGVGFHESLSMERFTQPWVQRLLPFRMPRWG